MVAKVPPAWHAEAIEMRKQGYSIVEISTKYDKDISTVQRLFAAKTYKRSTHINPANRMDKVIERQKRVIVNKQRAVIPTAAKLFAQQKITRQQMMSIIRGEAPCPELELA